MARLKFHMYLSEECKRNRGICSTFTDGTGYASTTWWTSPPDNIDHVDITYLQGRFNNVKTKRHVAFIQAEFKKQMKNFELKDEKHVQRNEHHHTSSTNPVEKGRLS